MKKIVMLITLGVLVLPALTKGQEALLTLRTPEFFLEFLRDRQKPALIAKLKLTDEQAEKVIAVQVWAAPQLRNLGIDMPEEKRFAGMKLLNEEKKKKYKAIPLTDEKVEEVILFYENMLKNRTWPDGETSFLKQ